MISIRVTDLFITVFFDTLTRSQGPERVEIKQNCMYQMPSKLP